MSIDRDTLRVYAEKAADYAEMTRPLAESDKALAAFIAGLPARAQVLDVGCGPGHAAARMAKAGLRADAVDACPAMVDLATRQPGVRAWLASFDDLTGSALYDGIWANFSLLHLPRAELPDALARLRELLKPGGLFHVGMKSGTGSRRDDLGRIYTYYTRAELSDLLREAGLVPFCVTTGEGVGLDGQTAPWIAITANG